MFVETSVENHILNINLNRPKKKNAFNPEMISEITNAFNSVEKNNEIRGVLLTGSGDCFSAGADLEWMKSMVNYSLEENKVDSKKLFDMFMTGLNCPVPVVGAFQGYVMGGATGLVSICDIGLSLQDTKYAFSEVKIGLAPAVISPFILNKMNKNKANEFMLTGKMFSADEALSAGLIEYVVDRESYESIINKLLDRLRKIGPIATRETKKLIRNVKQISVSDALEATTSVISERRMSTEGQEGLASFFEKRKPNWIGE